MEGRSQEEATCDEEPADHAVNILAQRLLGGLLLQDGEKTEARTGQKSSSGVIYQAGAELGGQERDGPSVSPSSLMDTCGPSMSSCSSSLSHPFSHLSSSSSSSSTSLVSLSPPLPSSVELPAVLTDTRLTLDVYQGGAGALPGLWRSVPERLRGVQYLRLGSEDERGLSQALDVLHCLANLRSVTIRGHCFYDARGDPLPGLLSDLPASLSSLSHLAHLDLSFNQLSRLPVCLLSLPRLSSLLLCHNRLSALPADVGRLSSLTYLSLLGNELVSLPASLGQLKALQTLDVSHNLLQRLPDEIGSLEALVRLELSHNKLRHLPESMGSLLLLRELLAHSNHLHLLPQSLNKLPSLKIDARGNPLGRPPTPPPLPPAPDQPETKIPELHLSFNQHRGG